MRTVKSSSKFDLVLSAKQTAKLFILQCKTITSQPILVFLIFLFPIIITLGIGVMVPAASFFVAAFSLTMIIVIGLTYGNIKYSMGDNTLGENGRLTVINQIQSIIAYSSTVFVFSFLSYNLQLLLVIFGESTGLLFIKTFVFFDADNKNSQDVIWLSLSWISIYAFYTATFTLTLSSFYLASTIFKTQRTFSMFVLGWFLICLCFSGEISTIWNWFDPNTNEFITESRLVKGWQDFPAEQYENAIDYSQPVFNIKDWSSWMGLIVPQWFTNQHFFWILRPGAEYMGNYQESAIGLSYVLPKHFNLLYWSKTDWLWNFSMIAPYLFASIYTIIGMIIVRRKQ